MAHILVIDDDANALEAITIALEENGHSTKTADDGEAGLLLVGQEPFDLVITDLIMPGKEGIETLMEIKQNHASLKVMAISGGQRSPDGLYLNIAKTMGADDVLAKPFTYSELVGTVDQLLAQC